jgi:threonine/homoserine/homoserine lactone efflux protein
MLGTNLALFVAASLALIVAPGPDTLYVLARGIGQGRRAGVISALGTCSGILVHTMLAALGLAVLLKTSPLAYLVVKYAGAAYLIYLGIKALRSHEPLAQTKSAMPQRSHLRMYAQGLLTNVLNPKVALFFVAFLPQFVHPQAGPPAVQMLALGLLFDVMGLAYLIVVALLAGAAGRLLAKPRWQQRIRWLSGSILIALGLRLALPDQR